MGTKIKLRGDKQLGKQMRRLSAQRDDISVDCMKAWGDDVQSDARRNAPERTGKLKRGITVRVQKQKLSASVGTHNGPFYGHFMENGTSEAPAQPFLGPAFNANRDIAPYMRDALEKKLP